MTENSINGEQDRRMAALSTVAPLLGTRMAALDPETDDITVVAIRRTAP